MNLLEKLDALKAKTGDSNASLAKRAGIPATTIYGLYQKGYANMQLSTLEALCNYFGVSLDYLAKDDDITEAADTTSGAEQTSAETELITIYRDLNELGQQALLGTARGLAANPDMKRGGESRSETA